MPSCVILKESQSLGLPSIPPDGSERHTSWLFVTGEPGFKYEGEWIDVDEDWITLRSAAKVMSSSLPSARGHKALSWPRV